MWREIARPSRIMTLVGGTPSKDSVSYLAADWNIKDGVSPLDDDILVRSIQSCRQTKRDWRSESNVTYDMRRI